MALLICEPKLCVYIYVCRPKIESYFFFLFFLHAIEIAQSPLAKHTVLSVISAKSCMHDTVVQRQSLPCSPDLENELLFTTLTE